MLITLEAPTILVLIFAQAQDLDISVLEAWAHSLSLGSPTTRE